MALGLFAWLRYDWKALVRAELLMKGYFLPELRTKLDAKEFVDKQIQEFAICWVYSKGQYVGYISANLRFVPADNISMTETIDQQLKRGTIIQLFLLIGQTISIILVVIFFVGYIGAVLRKT